MTREDTAKLDLQQKLDALAAKVMARAALEHPDDPPTTEQVHNCIRELWEAQQNPPPKKWLVRVGPGTPVDLNLFGQPADPIATARRKPRGRKPKHNGNYRCLDD